VAAFLAGEVEHTLPALDDLRLMSFFRLIWIISVL